MHPVGHDQWQVAPGVAAHKQDGRQLLGSSDLAEVFSHLGVIGGQGGEARGAQYVLGRMDFDLGLG